MNGAIGNVDYNGEQKNIGWTYNLIRNKLILNKNFKVAIPASSNAILKKNRLLMN